MSENKMPFHPMGTFILLEEVKEEERTRGGIIIPEKHRNTLNQGRLVEFGNAIPLDETGTTSASGLKVGDMIVFPMHVEHRIEIDRTWFIIIDINEVMLADHGYFATLQKEEEQNPMLPSIGEPKRRAPIGLKSVNTIGSIQGI